MQLHWNQRNLTGGKMVITTIDAHTAGEPFRIITGGLPELEGTTILERRQFMHRHYDFIRQALMWEPRGHYNMYGCVVTEPVTPEADVGVLFMHNEGYSTMCGHGTIALVTVLLETGAIPIKGEHTPVNLDTPAGLVRATAHFDDTGDTGRVAYISFLNVPSFLYARDIAIDVPVLGRLTLDIAFGGAFYAILPAAQVGLSVAPAHLAQLAAAGQAIKVAVNETLAVNHPFEADLSFVYGTIFTGPPENPAHHSRNICIFANAEVDRSPTGTGVSARLALHSARGEITDDQTIIIESILGAASVFRGRVFERTQFGPHSAIVPEVSGTAHIVGRNEWIIDPRDTLGKGFLVS